VDADGNVYVADTYNNLVRKITLGGEVSTLAGLVGVSGVQDGGGADALFNHPGGLAVDGQGNLYLADTGNSTIRRITADGHVSTLAGLPGVAGMKDGVGIDALFNQPLAVCINAQGVLYVADTGNAVIRRIGATVTTLDLASLEISEPVPSTPNPPTTPTAPTTPTETTPASSSGGGGGGAVSPWLLCVLGILWLVRRLR
jgi:sugar lactone lactonase YvrE